MNKDNNLFRCYVNIVMAKWDDPAEIKQRAAAEGNFFRNYIWNEKGLDSKLKQINRLEYESDVNLILFQFYVNPTDAMLSSIKSIGKFSSKEKSISAAIIINRDNFFTKSEKEKNTYIKNSILNKYKLMVDYLEKKKIKIEAQRIEEKLEKVLQ